MNKSNINPLPNFFDRYINLVVQDNLFDAFDDSSKALYNIDLELFNKIGNKTYQADKWTTKDVLQHIIDNERIQSYRALRFARLDDTVLPGYDEKLFGQNSNASNRSIEELINELKALRISTIQLFKSFDQKDLQNSGICFNQKISVLALGFVIIGHQTHHLNFIDQKYISLAS